MERNVLIPTHLVPMEEQDLVMEDIMHRRRQPDLDYRLNLLVRYAGRLVLLVRNPFKAIVSWWNHAKSGDTFNQGLKRQELIKSMKTQDFCQFAEAEASMWKLVTLDAIALSTEILVIHFETFQKDKETHLKHLLNFLRIPVDENRLECIGKHALDALKRKRSKNLPEDIFCDKARKAIEDAIEIVRETLVAGGHPDLPVELYEHFSRHPN